MSAKTFLSTVDFSKLQNWDVKTILGFEYKFSEKIPLVLFGAFLYKANIEKVKINDKKTYSILGVRSYGKGVYINRTVEGGSLKMKTYQQSESDTLFWCKVDTKNGAFGVVDKELSKGVASTNMTFAKIDTSKALTSYVQLLFCSTKVNSYMDNFVTGTTNRKYIKPNQLLSEIFIPLPSLEEQNKIVEAYLQRIKLAEQAEQEANKLEEEIENYIYSELGIQKQEKQEKKKGLQFVRFKNLNRWDTDFLLDKKQEICSKYELTTYGNIFRSLKNGIAARNYSNTGTRYLKVSDIKNNTISDKGVKYVNKIKESDILDNQTLLITRKGTVGQSYFIKSAKGQIVASSEIFIIRLVNNVLGDYVSEINLTSFVQDQYREKYTGTIMPSLSQTMLKSIIIPLPPLSKQNEIVEHITALKEQIKDLRYHAEQNRQQAIKDFENTIFS